MTPLKTKHQAFIFLLIAASSQWACEESSDRPENMTAEPSTVCHTLECTLVSFGQGCKGAFLGPNRLLTSHKCADGQQDKTIYINSTKTPIGVTGTHLAPPSYHNNILSSGIDLAILETSPAWKADRYYQIWQNEKEADILLDRIQNPIIPMEESAIWRSHPEDTLGDPRYINYRYPHHPEKRELLFGSRAVQICQVGFIIAKGKILAVGSRPLIPQNTCGKHLSWVFTPTYQATNKAILDGWLSDGGQK